MRATVKRILATRIPLKRPEARPGKVRTRLTSSGWGFFGLVFCAFLMSVNFSNNLIFAMTFLLAAIAMVGWYHTRANVGGLAVADWRSEPVFAGQSAVYRLPVENRSKNNRHGLLVTARGSVHGAEKHLLAGETAELTLERPAPRRGRLKPAPACIRSCFPLGIFQARMVTGQLPECLVYPAQTGDQPLPARPLGRQAHLVEEAGTYTDMRRYSPGDPLARIHWKAMARFDELYTKEFDGGQGRPALWLRWEDAGAGGTEQKLSQLCRWVLEAHKQNREYGLELPGTRIEPANAESHLQNCLRALALHDEPEQAV
ncbi:hypothetical protein AW736_07200 [Termitidicoccus mucosus]|uniref:Uncharacterized protein n=2 Tax=Termitidicoccus mucosus TaxID=1184151 RepID=A0A178IN50_9BACT|nr:hypothetical protein AW736_07200 [Opitutaceae bacterium TSB47]